MVSRIFYEVTKLAFVGLGLDLTTQVWGTEYLGAGKSTREIAKSMGADLGDIGPIIDNRNKQYQIALNEPPVVRPHVLETLTALSDNVKMGIVTGCQREQLYLMHKNSGLLDFFEVIISAEDYSESKPHPAPYLTAMKSLGIHATNCIAVEDSQRGLIAAIAAGIDCVVVPTELTAAHDFSGAISVENDVSGIMKYIDIKENANSNLNIL